MLELKKCDKCGMYLLPFETDKGMIFLHPFNKDCPSADVNKAIQVEIRVLDPYLSEIYLKTYGNSPYSLENVFEGYDCLKEEIAQLNGGIARLKADTILDKQLVDSFARLSGSWFFLKHAVRSLFKRKSI